MSSNTSCVCVRILQPSAHAHAHAHTRNSDGPYQSFVGEAAVLELEYSHHGVGGQDDRVTLLENARRVSSTRPCVRACVRTRTSDRALMADGMCASSSLGSLAN